MRLKVTKLASIYLLSLLIDLRQADIRYQFTANPDHLTELVMAQPNEKQ